MKKIKLQIGILCCLLCLSFAKPLMAVEGYKNLKFGISMEELKKSKFCTFTAVDKTTFKVINVISCNDLKFNGKSAVVYFYFIDNKFLRLAIPIVPYNNVNTILQALIKKYGQMSSSSSSEDYDNYRKLPNQEINLDFDNNTIKLRYYSNSLYKKDALLIYTSPLFRKLSDEKKINTVVDDL